VQVLSEEHCDSKMGLCEKLAGSYVCAKELCVRILSRQIIKLSFINIFTGKGVGLSYGPINMISN
jgi:hypothetical protein